MALQFYLSFVAALTQNNKDKADIALDDTEMTRNQYGESRQPTTFYAQLELCNTCFCHVSGHSD